MDPLATAAALAALFATVAAVGTGLQLRHARAESAKLRTLLEKARRNLKAQRRRYKLRQQRLVDSLRDPLLIIGPDQRIRTTNTAARKLFGPRELHGRPVAEAFLDQRLSEPVIQCIESGEPANRRVVLPAQSAPDGAGDSRGESAWIIDASPLKSPASDNPRALVVLRDVTAEHHAAQIRKDFVANASHELRTPLAIISGYLENLIDDHLLENPELSLRFLKVMRKHTTRISRIIEDMLVISRLESGEAAALRINPFPFRACIEDVLERLESMIRSRKAEIRIDMPDPDLLLDGDRFYWTQILFNLVENALKQNPRPGLEIEIGCRRENQSTRIHVADNGVGIPNSDIPYLFKRFYRVEKHHSQDEIPGTGLGLSIVKRAVEAHRGTIRVDSSPGQNTRFTIEIP